MSEETALFELQAPRVILLVEDEVLVRLSAAEDLRQAGYEVIEAANADEALSLLEADLQVDLVLSDVNMPGTMNGLDLLDILRERYPAIVRLLTSGATGPNGAVSIHAAAFLPKPYSPDELLAFVGRHVLPGT